MRKEYENHRIITTIRWTIANLINIRWT